MAITLSTDGYCQESDLEALLQQFTIDANSNPNSTEVEAWITQDFGEINAVLRAAGYAAPVAQAGGSLQVSAGTITVQEAADAGNQVVRLVGSGGTLSGVAHKGDFFTVGSDPQIYMVQQAAWVDDGGEVNILFAPALELDAAAAATITFTASGDASAVLKKLNATMTSIRVLIAAYMASGADPDGILEPLKEERAAIIKGIRAGHYDFPSIPTAPSHQGLNTAKVIRA